MGCWGCGGREDKEHKTELTSEDIQRYMPRMNKSEGVSGTGQMHTYIHIAEKHIRNRYYFLDKRSYIDDFSMKFANTNK